MVSIRFIRDTSRTHATPSGGRRVEKIAKNTQWDDLSESSANWWVAKGDAVRVSGKGAASRGVPALPQVSTVSPFVNALQGIEDGDFERVFSAFAEISEDDIAELNITDDSKLVLTAARGEVGTTGGINDVALPDLTDAVREAVAAVQSGTVPPPPPVLKLPPVPKGRGGRKPRA